MSVTRDQIVSIGASIRAVTSAVGPSAYFIRALAQLRATACPNHRTASSGLCALPTPPRRQRTRGSEIGGAADSPRIAVTSATAIPVLWFLVSPSPWGVEQPSSATHQRQEIHADSGHCRGPGSRERARQSRDRVVRPTWPYIHGRPSAAEYIQGRPGSLVSPYIHGRPLVP